MEFFPSAYERYEWRNDLCCRVFLVKTCLMIRCPIFFGFGRMMPQISSELYGKHAKNLMKTDVRELDGSYELDVDLPGFKKDEVTVDLQDGYLTISAAKALDKDESDQKGKFLRQERYAGSMSRSFYVGDDVESADISAKYEDGILKISVPKAAQKELPKHTTIAIE